ncbi:hypothetical protein KEC56_01900 [Microbacterium sp. YMB-B2]|uniref:Uncharacterized protein n=1 Tax=Microbacterium tenebrionis TaxID=2830665 RepID=A0A9X1LMA5_9MICO|nr:hypothetical protein [Microbacterium tenebrionis]MCC2028291.1 hypothetical protein [Microbacterium tenebrionis]
MTAFDIELSRAVGADAQLDAWIEHTRGLAREVASAPVPDASARRLVTTLLALALQGSLLVRHAPHAVADACCGTRLSGDAFGGALVRAPALTALAAPARSVR